MIGFPPVVLQMSIQKSGACCLARHHICCLARSSSIELHDQAYRHEGIFPAWRLQRGYERWL